MALPPVGVRTYRAAVGPAVRVGLAFSALFFVLGVYLPFWPVWLQSRGLSPEWIGTALGLGSWARVAVNPVLGGYADRSGRIRGVAIMLAVGVLISYVAFAQTRGVIPLLALSVLLGCTFAPLVPLVDAIAVNAVAHGTMDYGRVRRWGSLAFIAGSVGVGRLLEDAPDDAVVYTLIGGAVVLIIATTLLPRGERPPIDRVQSSIGELLRRSDFRLFLLTCALLHGSHSMLYAYGTPHWRAAGIDDSTIGWLWAEGVIAEIALFSVGPRLAGRWSPAVLMVIAGVAGLLRWPALALTTSVGWLVLAQLLHGLTFAATHLGAMSLIRTFVPGESTTRATALYSAVATGLAFGVGLPIAGVLYDDLAGATYYVMAGVSALGVVAALRLRTRLS